MSESAELLAIRKELLLARSSLHRLKIARDIECVRESVSLGHLGSTLAGSAPAREMVLGLLLAGLGGGRASRLAKLAGRALVIARLALAAFGLLRSSPPAPRDPPGESQAPG